MSKMPEETVVQRQVVRYAEVVLMKVVIRFLCRFNMLFSDPSLILQNHVVHGSRAYGGFFLFVYFEEFLNINLLTNIHFLSVILRVAWISTDVDG